MNPHDPAGSSDVVRELGPTVAALVEARVYLAEGEPPRGARRSPGPVVECIVDLVRDVLAREEADVDEPDASLV